MVEDLDFDTGVWKSVGYEAFEGSVGGPEEEAGVATVGEVSPPADEFEVSVFLFGAKDTDWFSGAVNERAVPGPSIFVTVCALEVVFTEFDPTGAGGIDLDEG